MGGNKTKKAMIDADEQMMVKGVDDWMVSKNHSLRICIGEQFGRLPTLDNCIHFVYSELTSCGDRGACVL